MNERHVSSTLGYLEMRMMVAKRKALEAIDIASKKLRRSGRLELKERFEKQHHKVVNGPLGYFDKLPLELKFALLSYISVSDLSMLTICSKGMRNLIELYRNSAMAKCHLLPRPFLHTVVPVAEQSWYMRQFEQLGLLLKRSTCLYSTRDRLKLLQQFLQKYLCSIHKECENPRNCIALVCYGRLFHTVIAGWDDKECTRALEIIGTDTLMLKNLQNIVKVKPGTFPRLELHCRLFFTRVFLNQCDCASDVSLWLALLLKPFPMVHQARILFLLFGPMNQEQIQWYEMVQNAPANKEQSYLCFGELANAFRVLHHLSTGWNEDDVISVLEEITTNPEEWLSENVAHLLFLCGDGITQKVLNSKAVNGRIPELANLVTSLCLVCMQHEQSLTWVVNAVKGVCLVIESTKTRVAFLHAIVDTFREVIMDFYEFTDSEDSRELDWQHMLDAQAQFNKELILVAFKNVIS